MTRNMFFRPVMLLVLAVAACGSRFAAGEEPVQKMLDALREKGFYDTAIDYLDQVKDSPLAPAKFKEMLEYERGVTLIEAAKHQRDPKLRTKILDDAQAALTKFVTEHDNHQLNFSAKNHLGNLIVNRAQMLLEKSRKPAESANKATLLKEARVLFDEAYKVFAALHADLKIRLDAMPKVLDEKKDAKRFELREQLRADFLQSQLLAAAVLEESAETVQKGSPEFKDLLTKAAKEYGEINNKYRTRIAGMYARMYQGRCFQKQDNFKDALSYFNELLEQPDEPKAFHVLKTQTIQLAVDCWLQDKKYEEVIAKVGKWIEMAYPEEMRDPDFMALRLKYAKACKTYVDEVKKKDPKDAKAKVILSDGRKQVQYVAKYTGDHQKEAQRLLGDFGVDTEKAATGPKQFKTFDDAKNAANEAIDNTKTAKFSLETLPERIRSEQDPAEKKKLQEQVTEAEKTIKDSYEDAFRICKEALALVDKDTSPDDLNLVRHLLCFLYYNQGMYYDAAVVGDFLSKRFPEGAGARTSAKIAMASYLKLYAETKLGAKEAFDRLLSEWDKANDGKLELDEAPEDRRAEFADMDADKNGKVDIAEWTRRSTRFESDRIIDIANYVNQKWPDQIEAQEALNTLITFMINEGELAKAEDYLSKIPTDSPQRGSAELKTGQALWTHYLRGMQSVRELEDAATKAGTDAATLASQTVPQKAELEKVKARAEKTLAEGVKRMEQSGKIDGVLTAATMSLAQIYVGTNQPALAIAILEHEKIGPLTLIAQNHEATQGRGYVQETFKVALRAYISALSVTQDAKQAEEYIKKAKEIMDKLKTAIASNPDGQKQLIAIYFTLAKDLQQQMDLAPAATKENLMKGFKTFLDQVGAGSNELNVLYWVATTFSGMGESADPKKGQGKEHFQQAVKTYQDILSKDTKKELIPLLDPQMRDQISLQLARTQRSMGDFEGAMNVLKGILTGNNMMLAAQVEAAKTLQEWGAATGELKRFAEANNGIRDAKGKPLVWGWSKLSNMTSNKPQFHNNFYEARYNIALTLYKMGMAEKTPDTKKKRWATAEEALLLTLNLFPKLDGDGTPAQKDFRVEYDGLIKLIQKARGEKESGLAGMLKAIEDKKQSAPTWGIARASDLCSTL